MISKQLTNWLPVNQKVHQSLNFTIFKYVNNVCPYYTREAFEYALECRISSRNNRLKVRLKVRVKVPFQKTNMWQDSLSYVAPSVWNKLPNSMKRNISLNTFKHDVKKHCLQELKDVILLSLSLLIILSFLLLILSLLFIVIMLFIIHYSFVSYYLCCYRCH